MLFNSLEFLLFFPLVVACYFLTPYRFRWALLLAASYYFYMCWNPKYAILLVISTIIDYWAGIRIAETSQQRNKSFFLVLSIICNLGMLFSFKYFNFVNESLGEIAHFFNLGYSVPSLNVLLPIGISFYTFQTMSYTIDIYRGKIKPEYHFGRYAVYVTFFPQLVAGPIERASHLLPQFTKKINFDEKMVKSGLALMLWGFFKKVVIADRLSLFNATIYNNPSESYGIAVPISAILVYVQVYADLSGYTDIARGAARVMGFDLMKNFNMPFFASSPLTFWRRWHISLTTWFTDYLYIPLGGNRVVKWRWYFNIFIIFFISGIWHGASWAFIIWGSLHGLLVLVDIWTANLRKKMFDVTGLSSFPRVLNVLSIVTTFILLGLIALFFGVKTVSDASVLISNTFPLFSTEALHLLVNNPDFLFGLFLVFLLVTIEYLHGKHNLYGLINRASMLIRWPVYVSGILFVLSFGVFKEVAFVYFQF